MVVYLSEESKEEKHKPTPVTKMKLQKGKYRIIYQGIRREEYKKYPTRVGNLQGIHMNTKYLHKQKKKMEMKMNKKYYNTNKMWKCEK